MNQENQNNRHAPWNKGKLIGQKSPSNDSNTFLYDGLKARNRTIYEKNRKRSFNRVRLMRLGLMK